MGYFGWGSKMEENGIFMMGLHFLGSMRKTRLTLQDVNSTREELSKSKLLVTKREQPNLVSFNLSRGGE